MLYAAIVIAVINVVAVIVIARLGRRLSTTEERVEIGRLETVPEPPVTRPRPPRIDLLSTARLRRRASSARER
jgi:hypothetical protein